MKRHKSKSGLPSIKDRYNANQKELQFEKLWPSMRACKQLGVSVSLPELRSYASHPTIPLAREVLPLFETTPFELEQSSAAPIDRDAAIFDRRHYEAIGGHKESFCIGARCQCYFHRYKAIHDKKDMAEGHDWGCVNERRLLKKIKRTRRRAKMRGIPVRKCVWKGHEPTCNLSRMMPTVVRGGCTCAEARTKRRSVEGQLGQLDWFESTVLSKMNPAAVLDYHDDDSDWGTPRAPVMLAPLTDGDPGRTRRAGARGAEPVAVRKVRAREAEPMAVRNPTTEAPYSLRTIKTPIKTMRVREKSWPKPPSRELDERQEL